MRVALLYPPPWKVSGRGEPPWEGRDGPPEGYREGDLDGDFFQIPYGLLTLASEAMAAGHQVKVLNLSAFSWTAVEEAIGRLEADLFGLSCWTANRRGVALTAEAIRRRHPRAVVVVGGPHASALPRELLAHCPAIDVVTVGEGEATFVALLGRLARCEGLAGLPGAVYRHAGGIEAGPARPRLDALDALVCPQRHFPSHVLMTSRGCPWSCSFCGAEAQWGRGFRAHSVEWVLDALATMAARLPVKMVLIKDDTFTTRRQRVLALCRGFRERGLELLWSCDTRVDLLDDELCEAMRLAGCERLSLGVESGSEAILARIDKRIRIDDVLRATETARRWGIRVRHYLMLGNRGETLESFAETLAFLARARPHEHIFSCLSVYPGTRDFADAERAGSVDREVFFRETFQELKTPFDADEACTAQLSEWFLAHRGLQRGPEPELGEREAVLGRLGDHHAAHVDVAGACYRAGLFERAEEHLGRARALGYPLPGIVLNYLACIAARRGDYDGMMDRLSEAARVDPQHAVLIANVARARRWFREGGPARGLPLALEARHDFELLERTAQPMLPGPLAEGWEKWDGGVVASPTTVG